MRVLVLAHVATAGRVLLMDATPRGIRVLDSIRSVKADIPVTVVSDTEGIWTDVKTENVRFLSIEEAAAERMTDAVLEARASGEEPGVPFATSKRAAAEEGEEANASNDSNDANEANNEGEKPESSDASEGSTGTDASEEKEGSSADEAPRVADADDVTEAKATADAEDVVKPAPEPAKPAESVKSSDAVEAAAPETSPLSPSIEEKKPQ